MNMWIDGCVDALMGARVHGWTDGWMGGWSNGSIMNGWMDAWTHGRLGLGGGALHGGSMWVEDRPNARVRLPREVPSLWWIMTVAVPWCKRPSRGPAAQKWWSLPHGQAWQWLVDLDLVPGSPDTPMLRNVFVRHRGGRVAVTSLVHRIVAGCREHGDARARCETRADGWFLDVKM